MIEEPKKDRMARNWAILKGSRLAMESNNEKFAKSESARDNPFGTKSL